MQQVDELRAWCQAPTAGAVGPGGRALLGGDGGMRTAAHRSFRSASRGVRRKHRSQWPLSPAISMWKTYFPYCTLYPLVHSGYPWVTDVRADSSSLAHVNLRHSGAARITRESTHAPGLACHLL